jgi:hypothetical protein
VQETKHARGTASCVPHCFCAEGYGCKQEAKLHSNRAA